MRRRESLALLLGLPLALGRAPAAADAPATIRVLGPANDGFKAVYYGVKSGIFAQYNLNVVPALIGSGGAATAALVGGGTDVASVNVVTVLQAHAKDIPMKIVSAAYLYESDRANTFMLCLNDAPIRSGKDLAGKTIGSPAIGDLNAVATMAWIDQTGGDSKSVTAIEVPQAAAVAFLTQGRAAAVTMNEPGASQAIATGSVRVLAKPLDAIAKRFQGGSFAAMEPFVEQNAEMMGRFARAMHDCVVYTNAHMADTVDLVAAYSGIAPEVVAKSNRASDPEYVDPRNIQPVIDALAKYGTLPKAFAAADVISSAALKPR
jgi:NitT/TauT family transport system substrate-binding protein